MIKRFKELLLVEAKTFNKDDAKAIGDSLNVDWSKVDLEQFRMGLKVESEHNDGSKLDVVKSKKDLGKIVLAHLKEVPNYYTKLKQVEEDAPANAVGSGAGVAGLTEPVGKKSVLMFSKRKRIAD
jgi:hypothetical protein